MLNGFMVSTDPRMIQLAILSSILCGGIFWFGLPIHFHHFLMVAIAGCMTQWAFTFAVKLDQLDMKSAFITALSLTLLLRAENLWLLAIAAFLAVASKFLLRHAGRHIFNPANFAITVFLLWDMGWASSGQWGTTAWLAALLCIAAFAVLIPSQRFDISWGFLGLYALMHFTRAWWLGDPLHIPMHHLQNGALLIFSFFMISDPKTTPSTRFGRMIFAACCAAIAFYLKFTLYIPLELFYALFATTIFYHAALHAAKQFENSRIEPYAKKIP
jgi:Na+-transporting NADH:ubiquinone oxidoreductase subunit NqrB